LQQTALSALHHAHSIFLKESLIDFLKTQGSVCKQGEKQLGSSEIIEAEWSEIDIETQTWEIPTKRRKLPRHIRMPFFT